MLRGQWARGVVGGGVIVAALFTAAANVSAAPRRSSAPTYPEQPKQPAGKSSDEYESPFPTKMNWNLSDVNGKAPPAEATLSLDENYRGTGTSGCNTWSASLYPQKGHRLAMGPVAQTKRSCGADVMQFERLYLGILHSGPNWDQVGYTLTIKSGAGALIFRRGL